MKCRPSWLLNGLLLLLLTAQGPVWSEESAFTFQKNVMIPMRDGVELAANIFLPQGDGPFPAILIRSPYGKSDEKHGDGIKYASAGYAFIIQDCRGKGDSKGVWDPFRYDPQDGYDTQDWISKQSWSNGKIGTMGGSYVGYTQWAPAPFKHPALKAMVPIVPFNNAYEVMYSGGAYQLALSMGWGAMVSGLPLDPSKIKLEEAFKYLPLKTWDDCLGHEIFYLRDWIAHPAYDEYWKQRGIDNRYADIAVPILNIGGWYDIFSKATIEMITRVRQESQAVAIRRNQFVIMGPWDHGVNKEKVGELEFHNAQIDLGDMQFQWFEYWLKGKDTPVKDWPPYYIYVMGINQWRAEYEWPLARTQYTNYYLHSQGKANTRHGDGSLCVTPPQNEKADSFVYDPNNPVPSLGGNNLVGAPAGPYNQQKIEERDDVLVYTSGMLNEPLEVTGPVKLVLYAASTAPDTDFTAKLVDVHPGGKAYNLCEGIIRAQNREAGKGASLIEPGRIYQYEIDLWVTSNVFLPGHRIRVEVSSSNFPRFDRNPNSGKEFGTDTELLKATQTIYHNEQYPSHIVLPVIPKS